MVAPLNSHQLETLRKKLLIERELNFKLGPEVNLNFQGEKDPVDVANYEIQGETMAVLRKRMIEKERMFQLALNKILDRTYGKCLECGGSIGFVRLTRYPLAEHCISCKEEVERRVK